MRTNESTSDADLMRRLYGLTRPHRRTIAAGMLCLILSIAAELTPPLIWKLVIDVGLAKRDWLYCALWIATLPLVYAVAQGFSALRGVLLERAGQRLTIDLRLELYRRLQNQSASFYARHRSGDLMARLTADVNSVGDILTHGTDTLLASFLRVIGVAAIFIVLQPLLGLIVILPMLLVGLFLWRFNHTVRPVYRAARVRLGELAARMSDNLAGVRVIQSFAQERRELAAVTALGENLYVEQVAAVQMRNRAFPLVRWLSTFGNVLMLGGGVFFIARGQFTLGGLLAYRGYGRYFFGPIDDLVTINDLVQQAAAAGRRIFEIFDQPQSIADRPDAQPPALAAKGELRFEQVHFGYDPAHPVLQNLNLQIRPGERIAIFGPSGIGKSTLLALVARIYDPDAGRVLLDGHDLRDLKLESLRAQIAQVQQETYLFNTSVLENLRYGRPDADRTEVEAAAQAANAHAFIVGLPRGYDTIVGERGVRLSGGQKQRIAIARALLMDAPILLLDEPTSAVEPESEELIMAGLERLMVGRTALIVSHRLSLARNANRVFVIRDGVMTEQEHAALGGMPEG
ncbi:MAG: ABC transporter ATP-binding protein [Oscillochloris sp.]|nr:ABC transporter ATP-binding protein [Oscillochloris sp.]